MRVPQNSLVSILVILAIVRDRMLLRWQRIGAPCRPALLNVAICPRSKRLAAFLTVMAFSFLAMAQADVEPAAVASERLTLMKRMADEYQFTSVNEPGDGEQRGVPRRLHPEPLLRYCNPVTGLQDGVLHLWVDSTGRPAAAAQFLLDSKSDWVHEFQSLTDQSFIMSQGAKVRWAPRRPGIRWRLVTESEAPGRSSSQALVPDSTAGKRLLQMKSICERFTVADEFNQTSTWDLRLLPRPVLRYAHAETGIVDGALFLFVHTTDPELFVMLEAVDEPGQPVEWRYAVAPMTAYALNVKLDGKTVYDQPFLDPWNQGPAALANSYRIFEPLR